jgi:hypothetical protein
VTAIVEEDTAAMRRAALVLQAEVALVAEVQAEEVKNRHTWQAALFILAGLVQGKW